MKRRTFVRNLAAAAVAVSSPSWLARAFGAEIPSVDPGDHPVVDAYLRARADHRLVLVFVIPQDHGARNLRGHAFGAFLNFGSDAQLAPLHGCEVVCAKMAAVSRFHPGRGEPLMLLIDPASASVRRLDGELLPDAEFAGDILAQRNRDAYDRAETQRLDGNISRIARLVGRAVPTAGNTAEAAAEVRARLVKHRVPGSRWAYSGGCGEYIEDEKTEVGIACGMGHVPAKSRRFLYWFKRGPYEEAKDGD